MPKAPLEKKKLNPEISALSGFTALLNPAKNNDEEVRNNYLQTKFKPDFISESICKILVRKFCQTNENFEAKNEIFFKYFRLYSL